MAAGRRDPPRCKQDIYKRGVCVEMLGGVADVHKFDELVRAASRRYGIRMDWHFSGGRARLLCMPRDIEKASLATEELIKPFMRSKNPEGTMGVVNEESE